MGANTNISQSPIAAPDRRRGNRGARPLGLEAFVVAALGLALALAAPSRASEPAPDSHGDRPVSTSPVQLGHAAVGPPGPSRVERADAPPLTRAAAQQRIETMSPEAWLAGFGSVRVERRD